MKNYLTKTDGIKTINKMLNKEIRDFYTYNKLVRKLLDIKTNIPIYINKKMVLLPTKSYKSYDCVWLNYYAIKDIISNDNRLSIMFKNGEVMFIKISINRLNRIINNALKIIEYFRNLEFENVIN